MSDRDPDSTGREPEDPVAGDSPGDGAPEEGPPPATWAGRRGEDSSPEQPSDDGGEELDPVDAVGEDEEAADDEPLEAHEHDVLDHEDDGEDLQGEDLGEEEPDGEDGDTAERLGQDTVEADTLALADREAAREAALAGLRARAAEHAAKHGNTPVTARPPVAAQPDQAAAESEQPPAQQTPVPAVAAAAEEPEGPPRRGMWARFAAGSALIIVVTATATTLSLLFFIHGVLADFHPVPGVQNQLVVPNPGDPQTILILGSDQRPTGQDTGSRSDTTILLRVASNEITVLSIPRDLRVNIPGYGVDKFNAAYSYGKAKLTLKVVKQLTGITDINHVVNIGFTGFADAVNALGCVYVDVDHHYYHSNLGLAAADQYAELDIPAGYQRMCGYNALQYVRYRHDDNDLVRSARQQEFLREMRQELPASRIFGQFPELVDILHKYVALDLENSEDVIALGQLIAAAANAPVIQVPFPATLGPSYVTASDSAIKAAVAKFEGKVSTPAPSSPESSGSGGSSSGGSGSGGSPDTSTPAPPPLVDTSTMVPSAHDEAAKLAAAKTKSGKPMLDIPVYYPNKLAPDSTITTDSRAFPIDGPGSDEYRGYKIVVSMPTDGYTAYYGVSGTDWADPPILDHPDETRTLDGQEYLLSWDGPQLRLIGWKTDEGTYWVDNTLLNALTPGQMFGIAQSMQKYTG